MSHWIDALSAELAREPAVIRVVVTATRGSAPREAGATMLVSMHTEHGTIGGGHLELEATKIARAMLADGAHPARVDRFVLGATLGQCCGGVVELAFDRFVASDAAFVETLRKHRANARRLVLATTFAAPGATTRSAYQRDDAPDAARELFDADAGAVAMRVARAAGTSTASIDASRADRSPGVSATLYERIDDDRTPLWIFGAGHVGRALVRALDGTPFRTTWIDDREHAFAHDVPAGVVLVASDDPVAEARDAPAACEYIVLTHSHDLDFELVRAVLARGDAASVGLIGSASKAARFRQRLARMGIAPDALAKLRCPIGIAGIDGKVPAVIAIAIAAELVQRDEAARAQRRAAPRSLASASR